MKDVFFSLGKEAEGISGVKGAKACASFTAGTLWPYKLILHLAKSLLASAEGLLNIQTNTPVTAVTRLPSGGFKVTTPRGTTFARKVVYTNNAYISVSDSTRAPLLNNSYIMREEHQMLSYLIPRADRGTVVGGANSRYRPFLEQWYNNVDDSSLIAEIKDYYNGYMQRLFHGWEHSSAAVDKVWTGVMGYSWDSHPHVGALLGEKEDQFVLAGFNGHAFNKWIEFSKNMCEQ